MKYDQSPPDTGCYKGETTRQFKTIFQRSGVQNRALPSEDKGTPIADVSEDNRNPKNHFLRRNDDKSRLFDGNSASRSAESN
ncbi:hypothetical protein M8J76_005570 [Diaphorina citri]|nr:hypothetical protein M8J75_000989 [Diaphorina citri]KAI5708895.1 hypothetical protein M8J76_005570 [Diaphorina citri]